MDRKMKTVKGWALVDASGEAFKALTGLPEIWRVKPISLSGRFRPTRVEIREVRRAREAT